MAKKSKTINSSFILLFYLVLTLFLSFTLLLTQVVVYKQAAGEEIPPQNVEISNIYSQGFTVSWFTNKKTSGAVIFSSNKETIEKQSGNTKVASDVRGSVTWSNVHYITLENLNPAQNYYFALKSGTEVFYKRLDGSWAKDGFAAEQKTAISIGFDPGKSISPTNTEGAYSLEEGAWSPCSAGTEEETVDPCYRPNFIWGSAVDEKNQPVKEAVIFAEIPAKSSLISTLTNSQGKWTINLAGLLKSNLETFQTYDPEVDLLRLRGKASDGKNGSIYQLIPHVFAQNCLDLLPQDCQTSPLDKTNPVVFRFSSPLTPTPTLKPTPTPTKKPIGGSFRPSPTPTSQPSLELKLKLQGIDKKGPSKTIALKLTKPDETIPLLDKHITVDSDEEGQYTGQISPVPTGTFTIFVKEPTRLNKKETDFVIGPAKNELDLTDSPLLAGDLNNNDRIDIEDLGILLGEYRQVNTQESRADLNLDGQVNGVDLGILLSNYRLSGE